MPPSNDELPDWNTEIALFRYGLIAPLLQDPPPKSLREQALRELATKTYRIPGSARTRVSLTTLRRYLKAYQAGGFERAAPAAAGRPGNTSGLRNCGAGACHPGSRRAASAHHPDAGRVAQARPNSSIGARG